MQSGIIAGSVPIFRPFKIGNFFGREMWEAVCVSLTLEFFF